MASPLSMTRAEREQFLADAHVAVLAVERPDGPPLISPVWYGYEPGGDVWISTSDKTVRAGLLRAAGRASMCAQRESLPYAYVTVEGPVAFGEITQEERLRLAVRYLGNEMAQQYVESTAEVDNVLVTLTPQSWRTTDYAKLPSA
jgi:PPOX class probable F420-dependent enzyme